MKKIIVAGGEPALGKLVTAALRKTNYLVERMETLNTAQAIHAARPDLLIWEGSTKKLRNQSMQSSANGYKVLLLSSDQNLSEHRARTEGADALVHLPFSLDNLRRRIDDLLQN